MRLQFLPPATKLGQGYVFTPVCDFVHKGGVWYPSRPCSRSPVGVSQHTLQVSRPTPKGEVEGSGLGGLQAHTQGVSRTTPRGGLETHTQGAPGPHPGGGLQAHPRGAPGPHLGGVYRPTPGGCILACTEADIPPRRLLLRAVRILLECILVVFYV